ncbi:MAG: HlyD family type I secretion periplasmic adaptor subunit [Hyphomicrobiaceae bacterium]|nr:HlyD family type I secretion periplasmic adaptor subunit [Hyphomicrobiaceae bacterium]MCC0007300.1 HlyD family type I secretion periplasmic adaptor subunit [Hyphomicrobiaceae bacterium]
MPDRASIDGSGQLLTHTGLHHAASDAGSATPARNETRTTAAVHAPVHHLIFGGVFVVLGLFGGFGLWAARTELAGAVIAPATVVVESSVKKVQHPTGGIVGAIHVRNGDLVREGDLLITLDDTQTRANLQILTNQIVETSARLARLTAEQTGAATLRFPDEIEQWSTDTAVSQIINGETVLFDSRRLSLEGQEKQLRERILQFEKEIAGLTAQRAAKATEIELISSELASLATLEQKRLVPASKMIALRREAARLKGEHAQIEAGIAQAKGRIAEVEIVILQQVQQFKKEVAAETRDAQARQAELSERRVAAEDQLKRINILAPVTGHVHQLAVHTVGGVVSPAEPILLIVPDGDALTLDAQVAPRDREQIALGATAKIRFAAFNQRTTPEIEGRVKLIAADLSEDRRTGLPYYSVRIAISDGELARIAGATLVPGLPADVQIRTESRTALSYLVKPIEDQFAKAFRER